MPNPQETVFNVVPAPNPAGPGNLRAATHGAYSVALLTPRAEQIKQGVLEAHGHLDPAKDGPAVARYAVALARCERTWAWLAEQPDDTFSDLEQGTVHSPLDRLARWEGQCDAAEHRLGISPLQRVKLGLAKVAAVDAATALSEPDPAVRRALLERLGLIVGSDDDGN